MYTQEQALVFSKEYKTVRNEEDIFKLISNHKDKDDYEAFVEYICDALLDFVSRGFYKYDDNVNDLGIVQTFLKVASEFARDNVYYQTVAAFFNKDYENCLKYLDDDLKKIYAESPDLKFDDFSLAVNYMIPFKNAFPGFWEKVEQSLSENDVELGVKELCAAVPVIYTSDSWENIKDTLENVLKINANMPIVKELLAYTYYNLKMYGNAVSLFEQLEDFYVFLPEDAYFWMAWSYGRIKETAQEIEYYQKCHEIFPEMESVLNNLGYAYFKAKQYNKALEVFKECLDKKQDVKYATNNYVRTLLAMKRFKDAKAFLKSAPVKISKSLVDRVNKAENTNKRITSDDESIIETDEIFAESGETEKVVDFGAKKQQFSSEKLLEDELTMRIESGMEVFGRNLKIYRRKGIYGRQYILPNGKRLDLLAEDDNGDLYIIELKKDSGYDDVYEQTSDYLNWFEKNWHEKDKKFYGIICLNSPTKALLNKVHNDKRMRVFEYQISYTEL